MHEHERTEQSNRQYAYDVTKITVLNAGTPNTVNELTTTTEGMLPLAKILNDFEKSYEPGKKILNESKKRNNSESIIVEGDKLFCSDGSKISAMASEAEMRALTLRVYS